MGKVKQKATKEIVKRSKTFVSNMNALYKKLLADAKKEGEEFPKVTFALGQGSNTKLRSPEKQAEGVILKNTKVCWSAHMVDKARHVNTTVNGSLANKKSTRASLLGDHLGDYKKNWIAGLKKAKIRSAGGGLKYIDWDGPHVELPDSKPSKTDPLVLKCLDEYARLTRKSGKKKNASFEKKNKTRLESYFKKYEKK
ncbi:MAG: hypothetical protein JKY31_10265 [Rhodobacteraceae bacterium]|nr:hypothetical protein [Paracoccaceae bacterium]